MKKISLVILVILFFSGAAFAQNSVTENDIVGTWKDNFGISYVFDSKQGSNIGSVSVIGGVKGDYLIEGEELIIAFNNVLMTGKKPLSEDRKTLTLINNSGLRIILTKQDGKNNAQEIKPLALASVAYSNTPIEVGQLYIIQDPVIIQSYLGNNRWSARNNHISQNSILTFILEIPDKFLSTLEGYSHLASNFLTVKYTGRVQAETTYDSSPNRYIRMFHYFVLVDIDQTKL